MLKHSRCTCPHVRDRDIVSTYTHLRSVAMRLGGGQDMCSANMLTVVEALRCFVADAVREEFGPEATDESRSLGLQLFNLVEKTTGGRN